MTGLDPKGWSTMHRLHHEHSDTPLDPHSPRNHRVVPLMLAQLKSYNRVLARLIHHEPEVTKLSRDLDFEVSWLNRRGLWALPSLVHAGIAMALGVFFGAWLLAAAGASRGRRVAERRWARRSTRQLSRARVTRSSTFAGSDERPQREVAARRGQPV